MHPYATDSRERFRVAFFAVITSILIAWALYGILSKIPKNIPVWAIDTPAAYGCYLLLLGIFEKWLWKCRLVRSVGIVQVPNLSGKWNGILRSSDDNYKTDHSISLDIQQTWTHLLVTLRTEKSISYSIIGAILVGNGKPAMLSYDYLNEPLPDSTPDTMHMHRGMAHLALMEDGSLDGDYFTGRSRNTSGRMQLKRAESNRRRS
jgi:hypothetical protein